MNAAKRAPALHRFAWAFEIEDNGCWIWRNSLDSPGYGAFYDGKPWRAHRWAYLRFVGPIGGGLELDHLCRNRACVNPSHLEPVTGRENTRRSSAWQNAGAYWSAKTHCPQGHPYSGGNLYIHHKPDGMQHRQCRACKLEAHKRWRVRKKVSA